jgi:hypothetical protein
MIRMTASQRKPDDAGAQFARRRRKAGLSSASSSIKLCGKLWGFSRVVETARVDWIKCAGRGIGAIGPVFLSPPTETDRSEPLHQGDMTRLRTTVVAFLALGRPNFVPRRQRQFVDAGHARSTAHAFGSRRHGGP